LIEETREEGTLEKRKIRRISGIRREGLKKRCDGRTQRERVKCNFKNLVERFDGRWGEF